MKTTLKPRLSRRGWLVVDRTIGFVGEGSRLYSTPWLLHDIEDTCCNLLLEHSDEGEDSVGIEEVVPHMAAMLPGMAVKISISVTAIDGRKVSFELAAKDEVEAIGSGTHNRLLVDVAKTQERLRAKAAKWRSAGSA
jgi:fluoroacetyl-CoA thioesterase